MQESSAGPSGPALLLEIPLDAWFPINLEPVLNGTYRRPRPELLKRTDGVGLIYRGKRHWFTGDGESGKTWAALVAVVEEIERGGKIAYFDWEMDAAEIVNRLRCLGLTNDMIRNGFRYFQPDGPLPNGWVEHFKEMFSDTTLVIFDACTEAMVNEGLDPMNNFDVAKWALSLPRLAQESDATYIVIDHVVKDRDARGNYAIGGVHKRNLTDVQYIFQGRSDIAPGKIGRVSIRVSKDRPGGVREHLDEDRRIADMVLDAEHEGHMRVTLFPPKPWEGPTDMMNEIVEKLAKHPDAPLSKTRIADMVGGKKETKFLAIEQLIMDGRVVADGEKRGYPVYKAVPEMREPVPDDGL